MADAVAALYGERNIGVVYKYNTYLAAIVSVDSTRRVESVMPLRRARPLQGAQLYLEAGRQLYARNPVGMRYSGAWGYDYGSVERRADIHACRLRGWHREGSSRTRCIYYFYVNLFSS